MVGSDVAVSARVCLHVEEEQVAEGGLGIKSAYLALGW